MPRPGPRPYECMRRAWHSDRHQPIRGSVIGQIFRVATQFHSPSTKSNKEWQEKLPVVVLRAEEIIYSKANSEAEYLNPATLLDRLNDAIDTIIRREQTKETGQLLPPCIEAALNLGCKPVRTSRSDRHNNPRTYLTSRNQQHPRSVSPETVAGNALAFLPVSDSGQQTSRTSYSLLNNFAAVHHYQPLAVETNPSLNLGSVYPLCYGVETQKPRLRINNLGNTYSDTIFVGRPVISPALEPSRMDPFETLSCGRVHYSPNRIVKETALSVAEEESPAGECDLSLRLGICLQTKKTSSAYELEDLRLRVSQEAGKFGHSFQQINEGYCFYPRGTGYGAI
ncbi:hypothetical protein PHAVU_009G205400 [Phaseolus vulgaris]|uniref:Uncharacterized protein n=1 Tax=Phaseolus vulgaris TaxID=3885 RepID=V7AXL6_PHAVU|nr:hypothetical protein PHAVU_009G205400g [Phaseolus vulgaris]ESW10392.1 hypothetical protein PHAVU_009G205400g [Phaseolus vulgaris]